MCLKQLVPPEYCARCDVCCRFLDEETPLAPVGLSIIPYQDRFTPHLLTAKETLKKQEGAGFTCANFDPVANRCRDYENRPLDCQLYPFVVMWEEGYRKIVLGLDHKCPYANERTKELKNERTKELIKKIDPKYILRFQDDIEILEKIDIKAKPQLNKLLIGDKGLFEKYAGQSGRPVSSYSFVANYVWTGLLDYYWMVIDGNFCLFCKTKDTLFMPIPPLGRKISEEAIRESFRVMNENNRNKNCSRIEDITEDNLEFFEDLGYKVLKKGCEYIYRQKDLASLAGDRYKTKRALCNYFEKNYSSRIREFEPVDKEGGIALFKRWAKERQRSHKEDYYKALLKDSYIAHKKAMARFWDLGLVGRVVVVDGRIAAYTFGYGLDEETFVILFEVADLKLKGLAQFIFREFCARQARRLVNVMDDCGLETLKRVKMSYHPVRIEKTFCATS